MSGRECTLRDTLDYIWVSIKNGQNLENTLDEELK